MAAMMHILRTMSVVLLAGGLAGSAAELDLAAAAQALNRGNYETAVTALRELRGNGTGAAALETGRLFVHALLETGRYAEAVAESARLRETFPTNPNALVLKARALMAVGRDDEARDAVLEALTLDAQHIEARLVRLELAELCGDRKAKAEQIDFFFALYRRNGATTAAALTAVATAVADEDARGAWRAYNEAHKADPKYLDAYVRAGFHCTDLFAWGFARQEFEAALKRNPQHALAHAGLAQIYIADGRYPQAVDEIGKALATNPHLTLAHALNATILEVEDKPKESRLAIDAALATNPTDLDALSLLSVYQARHGTAVECEATLARIQKLNPRYVGAYVTLGQIAECRHQFPQAVEWARKAIAADPDAWQGHYLAGANLLRLGEEQAGYRSLERAFALNEFNVWAYNLLHVLDRDIRQHAYVRHDTAHMVLKLGRSDDALLWPYIEPVLEPMYQELAARYGFEPKGAREYDGRLLVLILETHDEFSARITGLPDFGALGVCFGQVVTLPSPRSGQVCEERKFNWESVLRHEMAHAVTLQKTVYTVPRWVTEGLSVLEMKSMPTEWDELLATAVAKDQLLPIEEMDSGFIRPSFPSQVPLSYCHAALVMRYLGETFGNDFPRRFLERLADSKGLVEALTVLTGRSMADLNRDSLAYVRTCAALYTLPVYVGPTDPAEIAAKLKTDEMNAALWLNLAEVQLAARRFAESREAVERAVTLDPNLARAHTILGIIACDSDKDTTAGREHFGKAIAANKTDFFAHLYVACIAEDAQDVDTAVAEYTAAARIYPRFRNTARTPHLRLARLYEDAGQAGDAVAILRELTQADPNRLDAWRRLAELLCDRLRQPGEAAE